MSIKVLSILVVVLILGGIFASVSFGVNQITHILEKNQGEFSTGECIKYDAPHALIVDGVAYCYLVYEGSERILPLETLQKMSKGSGT